MDEFIEDEIETSDLRIPASRLTSRVYGGMWGRKELFSVAVGSVSVAVLALLFVTLVLPARTSYAGAKNEQVATEDKLVVARERYGSISSTESQVEKLVASAETFEANYLPLEAVGRTSLYQRLNFLIQKNQLRATQGPEYSAIEPKQGESQTNAVQPGSGKSQGIFPGLYVTMTVEGSYRNIRKLISDIETGDQFIVITAVAIEDGGGMAGTVDVGSDPTFADPSQRQSSSDGSMVSLKIELAAYFRRADSGVER